MSTVAIRVHFASASAFGRVVSPLPETLSTWKFTWHKWALGGLGTFTISKERRQLFAPDQAVAVLELLQARGYLGAELITGPSITIATLA